MVRRCAAGTVAIREKFNSSAVGVLTQMDNPFMMFGLFM